MTQNPTLVIHPDRFEDVAGSIVNSLCNRGLIGATAADYDRAVDTVALQLMHQHWLNQTWTADDADGHHFRADAPDTD